MKRFNMGCLVKILVLVVLIAAGVFIYFTCSGGNGCIQSIDRSLPDNVKAPYQITTMTHLYYAEYAIQNSDGSAEMRNWYERLEDEWVYREGSVPLSAVLRPKVKRR